MRKLLLCLVCAISFAGATEKSRQDYLELIQEHPILIEYPGVASNGEIEILSHPKDMEAIERQFNRSVGLVARDKYWMWINDACRFPSGALGIYGRIVWSHALNGCPGVAVMPILPDGRIVLNCNFRHATRSWEIELPRGGLQPGEPIEEGARREVLEETGMVIERLQLLGTIPPDSGLTASTVPIFAAQVVAKQNPEQEEEEAIEEIFALPVAEIKKAFVMGYYECEIRGEKRLIHFRDPFLAYALLVYELKEQIK